MPTRPRPPATTYRDGVRAIRCVTCLQLVRTATGKAVAPVRVSDVETVIAILTPYRDYQDVVARLRATIGAPPDRRRVGKTSLRTSRVASARMARGRVNATKAFRRRREVS